MKLLVSGAKCSWYFSKCSMAMVFLACGLIIAEVFFNRMASGVQVNLNHQFDLIEGLQVFNNSYPGLTIVEGFHHFSPAILLQGDSRNLQLPVEMYRKITEVLSQTNEFTFIATIRQEEKNTGTIISFSEGGDRFLEIQSSGRRDEIRLYYNHRNNIYVETFPYHLADDNWHQIALSVSGNTVKLFVDCSRIYKRIIRDIDQNFTNRNLSLWLGQRNSKHFLFKGTLQDVKIIGQAHGYIVQCPHLDTECPTCGQFRQLQMSVFHLESYVKELTERLAHAEQQISALKECECQKSCFVNGSTHLDGSSWKRGCDICSCVHGEVKCRPVTCGAAQCKNPVHVPGECCPICLKKCLLENVSYDHGEHVSLIPCVVCECKNGSMHCRRIDPETSCPPLKCPEKEQFSVPGECCRYCPGVDYCGKGHNCHYNATCLNLRTQYACQCNSGFAGDGRNCEDIDECLAEGGHYGHHCRLNTKCVNLPGKYVCECLPGYVRLDSYNCIEYDECSSGEHGCHENAVCINTAGSYKCECLEGYSGDGFMCEPVCEIPCLNGGRCTAPGICSCRKGYSGPACDIDVDECSLGLHMCHPNSQCVNMPGWYFCQCKPGYESHPEDSFGSYCQDVNECLVGSHTCHMASLCINEEGTYHCECIDNSSCSSSCIYYGAERLNGEIWSADTCTKCRCLAGVVTCQPVDCDCTKPSTNFQCCPHCDHTSVCQHQEAQILFHNGDQWIYQCQICECLHGEIDCWEMECPPVTCKSPVHNPGDCCPRCDNDPCSASYNSTSSQPKGCSYNGLIYQPGEKIPLQQNPCSSCHCENDHVCCSFNSSCYNNDQHTLREFRIPYSINKDSDFNTNNRMSSSKRYDNQASTSTAYDNSTSVSYQKDKGLLFSALLTNTDNSQYQEQKYDENIIRNRRDASIKRKRLSSGSNLVNIFKRISARHAVITPNFQRKGKTHHLKSKL